MHCSVWKSPNKSSFSSYLLYVLVDWIILYRWQEVRDPVDNKLKGKYLPDTRQLSPIIDSFHPTNISTCQEACNAEPKCLVWTVMLDKTVDVVKCFLYHDNYPYAPSMLVDGTATTGFKYCNIASGDYSLWITRKVHTTKSNNPFYRQPMIGVQCHGMDVPHHCRRLPIGNV